MPEYAYLIVAAAHAVLSRSISAVLRESTAWAPAQNGLLKSVESEAQFLTISNSHKYYIIDMEITSSESSRRARNIEYE